jgi:hypothetical protein
MDAGYVAALSGLIGALIGSASSIATIIIQSKVRDRRDRSKQVTDLSLAEFKMHLDMAVAGTGPSKVAPISTYIFNNNAVLEALENGTLTADRLKAIAQANDDLFAAVLAIEKTRAGKM